jgi:type VI secretion system protein ImpL
VVLAAASSPTSPIKQLLESIRDETALTRERPAPAAKPGEKPAAAKPPSAAPTLLKQQGRAPGADIEATFKAYHVLVEGDGGRKPIDAILANLAEIYQSLVLLATNPSQAAVANAALQTQVASLRGNAARMPQPFQDMLTKAAGFFEGDLTNSSHAQLQRALGDQVTGVCNQIVPNRYPFTRGTEREVPLADFGKLFGPNGIIDRFFTQHLASLVNTSKHDWTWRQDSSLARTLSPATLREFQRAAQIRDAFFSTGGNMPSINLNVLPAWAGPDVIVKLEVNGTTIESKPQNSNAVAMQWPGAGGNRAAVSVTGTSFFGQASGPPSVLERHGTWALFRLIEAGSPVKRGDRILASFIVGGRELQYQFGAGSVQNPLMLPALREFHCPSGI